MRGALLLAVAAAVSAELDATTGPLQELVDSMFEKYLPPKATWPAVKACREKCAGDEKCLESCPKYQCPFARISEQCGAWNASRAAMEACHHKCGAEFACHFKCPMAKPTSVKELQQLGSAMLCHMTCGRDGECHKTLCTDPWKERQDLCGKLHTVVSCYRHGGSHATCPHLDEETKKRLLQEPESLAKDIADHVVDHILTLPAEMKVSKQEVRACHMRCGADYKCHQACPKGPYGIMEGKCNELRTASTCHHACEEAQTKCPFAKIKCHMKCPMSMPTSVEELKGLADHISCHTECGQDEDCHQNCPHPKVWSQKAQQCKAYGKMMECHKNCGPSHECHKECPRLEEEAVDVLTHHVNDLAHEVVSILVA